MVTLYPFLFRFGVSFNYTIPKEIISSLKTFFSKKFNYAVSLNYEENNYDCIAITDEYAQNIPSILSLKFNEKMLEYNISDFNSSIFFIDIKSASSGKFDSYLIDDLVKIINQKINHSANNIIQKFILYYDRIDLQTLTSDKLFVSHVKHKLLDYCFIFDSNGNYLSITNGKFSLSEDEQLSKLINEISTPNLEHFSNKLVRKINHFKRIDQENNDWVACQQFFYESQNCGDDTYKILLDEIILMQKENGINPDFIIFDSYYSKWFVLAITSVKNHISSEFFSIIFPKLFKKSRNKDGNFFDLNEKDSSINIENFVNNDEIEILFITDLIHTGNTFNKDLLKIKEKFPKNKAIHCISALITDYTFKNFKDTFSEEDRKIKIDKIEVRYFKKVQQSYIPKPANRDDCPMCKHKLLNSVAVSEEISENFSSYEMWLMCQEVGYKIEDYKPREDRKNINNAIPDSLELFKKNSPLIALRFEQQLKKIGIKTNSEVVIIFPNESKNLSKSGSTRGTIEKTPSGYLAKSLHFYNSNFKFLGLPRKMIQEVESPNTTDWDKLKTNYPKEIENVRNIKAPIIIVDENNFSGKSFMAISDILKHEGKNPNCFFPIFNYDSNSTKTKYDGKYSNVEFLSLYEFSFKLKL